MGLGRDKTLVDSVLEGRVRSIARLITRAEAGDAGCREALTDIYRHAGRAHIVGITGVPGAGKSTLLCGLVLAIRATGRKVGVIALDPTSPFSGGSILGDRIRMKDLAGDPGVFVRSMATRGALGGLAKASFSAVDVLDAAGFDMVLVETVGVGQDEVDIVRAAHTVVVISAPGLGDEVQAIKAGILEIADIHVVSKSDRADANRTITDLKALVAMGLGRGASCGWQVPVIATSAQTGMGLDDLLAAIDRHRARLGDSGEIRQRRQRMAEMRILKIADDIVRARYAAYRDGTLGALVDRVAAYEIDPHAAAVELLAAVSASEE